MRKSQLLLGFLIGLSGLNATTVQAATRFEPLFRKAIADQALDRLEYAKLQDLLPQLNQPEESRLAGQVLSLLSHYQSLVQLNFNYAYRRRQQQASFLFSPTYAENELLTAPSSPELYGKISQQDLLQETQADQVRCGAAALLIGHHLIYGHFSKAFSRLGISSGKLTYRHIHLAQEKLYQAVNLDGQDGLSQRMRYRVLGDGRVEILEHGGEIEDAARKIGLSLKPLKINANQEQHHRDQVIRQLWRKTPTVPLLVGVYLNEETGKVQAPDEGTHQQNHFVLIFKKGSQIWMYNSGVRDNGLQAAIRPLNEDGFERFVLNSKAAVNALYRK